MLFPMSRHRVKRNASSNMTNSWRRRVCREMGHTGTMEVSHVSLALREILTISIAIYIISTADAAES